MTAAAFANNLANGLAITEMNIHPTVRQAQKVLDLSSLLMNTGSMYLDNPRLIPDFIEIARQDDFGSLLKNYSIDTGRLLAKKTSDTLLEMLEAFDGLPINPSPLANAELTSERLAQSKPAVTPTETPPTAPERSTLTELKQQGGEQVEEPAEEVPEIDEQAYYQRVGDPYIWAQLTGQDSSQWQDEEKLPVLRPTAVKQTVSQAVEQVDPPERATLSALKNSGGDIAESLPAYQQLLSDDIPLDALLGNETPASSPSPVETATAQNLQSLQTLQNLLDTLDTPSL